MANSEDLSQSVGTHPARVRKVLSVLRKHGYLTTKEGAHGDTCLVGQVKRSSLEKCTDWLLEVHWGQAGVQVNRVRRVKFPLICRM